MKVKARYARAVLTISLAAVFSCTPVLAANGPATGDTSDAGIALSNSYAGNTWRQQMLKTWKEASQTGISNGQVAKTKIVNANKSAPEQSNQIGSLILQGWDAIAIDAASPTALNGVIKQACDAGIVVVVFDSLATAPCAYKVAYNYVDMGKMEADFVAKRLNEKGNVLEIRGIAGTSVDDDIHKGIVEGFSKYPNIKIVGSVHGNWTQTIAQKEVAGLLPTLPDVDAVVTQGGDGWGTYQAFKAADRPTPLIIMGNREAELSLWQKLDKQTGGYDTFSVSSAPGVASIAFWVAQQILAGKDVPKHVRVPLLVIRKDSLDEWAAATPKGGVATPVYSQSWTVDLIDANAGGSSLPESPLPK
ncbi:MAG TPA: ABC transporter substrate-binding protein [Gammaproteobacteria bacterium]|nr:ABC transporter substrate-binding protein [Gammaproteobacteria bacterium]